MAAAPRKTPEPNAPITMDFDSFEVSVPIPEQVPVQRANQLPFADLFEKMKGSALEGKQPHKFIPTAFWVARAADVKGGNPEKAKEPGYAKQKVRDQFNKWLKAAKVEGLNLIAVERKGTEEEVFKTLGIEPTAGLSIWLQKAA